MKQLRYWSFLPAFCLLALPVFGQGIEVGSDTAKVGDVAEVPILLHNPASDVQGVVVALDWDGAIAEGVGLDLGPVLTLPAPADADTVVTRIEASYAVLGVVMDADGLDDEVIPASPDAQTLATLQLNVLVADVTLDVNLADGAYATVDGGPLLDNIVVVGGLSIGAGEGLELTNGAVETVSCLPSLYIGGAPGNDTEETGVAGVMLENCVPVEGYVTALCHDPAVLELVDIAPGSAAVANGAELAIPEISVDGGTLAVIMDVDPPFDGQTLPVGVNQIALYTYEVLDDTPGPTALTFCDNVLGDPLKENVFVAGGLSFDAGDMTIEDGSFEVTEVGPVKPPAVQTFACGAREFGDALEGSIGGSVEVCYHLLNPEDNVVGTLGQSDQVQGFSMGLVYDEAALTLASTSLDISDTILEALGAEFTSVDAGNGELIIAVLVDALPPFDGATIPPSGDFQRMGCLVWDIADDPQICDTSLSMVFEDGVQANGGVPVRNLISVENVSSTPANFIDCGGDAGGDIEIVGTARFYRGDCNFSNESLGREAVDIADAAAAISYLFLPDLFKPEIQCLDACDCNDDGRIDLADAMCILSYKFRQGAQPPAPGPGWDIATQADTPKGEDPTLDLLDCDGGTTCD